MRQVSVKNLFPCNMSEMILRDGDINEKKAIALLFHMGKLCPEVQSRTHL